MRDDSKMAAGSGSSDVERELGRLVPAPVPPGLSRRILDRAQGGQANDALPLGLRFLAAACSIVILGALAIDPLIGKHEAARLSALIGVPKAARLVGQDSELIGAELGMNFEDIARAMRTRMGADSTSTTVSRKDLLEARNRLKRIDEHEDWENIF